MNSNRSILRKTEQNTRCSESTQWNMYKIRTQTSYPSLVCNPSEMKRQKSQSSPALFKIISCSCLYQYKFIIVYTSCWKGIGFGLVIICETLRVISNKKGGIVLMLFLLFPQRNTAHQGYIVCINLVIFSYKCVQKYFPVSAEHGDSKYM